MPKSKTPTTPVQTRPTVVAVMGHVDHGKTSLLDTIRGTNVQAGEAGGITQNTRAHQIEYKGKKMTFIDTPGHEAFSQMRSRGARVTDIVMLVVAADDGVSPQTKESIKFAKEAKVPIIVAINKIDLQGADAGKIKNQLAQNDVLVEEYGGDIQVFEVSAVKKTGIDELLEGIQLQAEIMELKAAKSPLGSAHGVVLESKLDDKKGAVALVLMKSGNTKVGEYAVYGKNFSCVRTVLDEYQRSVESANESDPVWIVGLKDVVPTGNIIYFTSDSKEAKEILEKTTNNEDIVIISEEGEVATEEETDLSKLAFMLATQQKNDDIKKLNLVLKTDSQGTLEAVLHELKKLNSDEVEANILSSGTGNITRNDILTAKNGKGIVLGFQVVVPSDLAQIIQNEKVLVRIYSVIYELVDEVSEAMDGMLEPEEITEEVARARVKKVFTLSDKTQVAGCEAIKGAIIRGYKVWVERNGEEIARGKITSLKRNKDEVKEVAKGLECGIQIDQKVGFEEGDEIVLYKIEKA